MSVFWKNSTCSWNVRPSKKEICIEYAASDRFLKRASTNESRKLSALERNRPLDGFRFKIPILGNVALVALKDFLEDEMPASLMTGMVLLE